MIEVLLLLLALVLVLACGGFVAAEFALVTVDRASVERAARDGEPGAAGVLDALRSLSTQLSSAQVGITVTNLLIGFLAEPALAALLDGPLESAGVPSSAVSAVALVVALVLATTVTMVLGELVPKNLAIARPLATASAVQGFQRGFTVAAGPLIRACNAAANALLRRYGVEPQEELASARSAEELASLVRRSAEQGTLEPATAALLTRSLSFGDRQAADVMTPRERMVAVGPEDSVTDVLRGARASGHSRFPVLDGGGDAVAGVLHIKDALAVEYAARDATAVRTVLRAPLLVPTTLALDELLPRLRRHGFQLAIVVNEFGGVNGVVTVEDLVEELVGDVRDEHDPADEAVRALPDGGWDVSGLLRPDEVADRTGLALPADEDYDTVAGLVAKLLSHVPGVGDEVRVALADRGAVEPGAPPTEVVLEVLVVDGLRVDRVALRPVPGVADAPDAEGDA